jgi:hypothetical protein
MTSFWDRFKYLASPWGSTAVNIQFAVVLRTRQWGRAGETQSFPNCSIRWNEWPASRPSHFTSKNPHYPFHRRLITGWNNSLFRRSKLIFWNVGTFKIRRFDTFSKCKSRRGGYRVIHGSQLKMSSRPHLYWGVTHVTLKDIASVVGTNGEEEYKSLKNFGLSRDCNIYREPIRLVRQIKVGEILNRASNFAYYNE